MAAAELSKLVDTVLAAAKRAEGGDAAEQASVRRAVSPQLRPPAVSPPAVLI